MEMVMPPPEEFFCPTKVLAGKRAIEALPFELAGLGVGKPLLLFGSSPLDRFRLKIVEGALGESGLVYGVCGPVPTDVDLPIVREVAINYLENGHDALVAVGGGTVVQTAKLVNIAVTGRPEDLARCVGEDNIPGPLNTLAVISTLGGTGYESTNYVSLGDRRYRSGRLMPDLMIIDPRMMKGTERGEGAAVVVTALTQAVEAALAGANPFVVPYTEAAIRFIFERLPLWLAEPKDGTSALALANACHYAGCAYSNVVSGSVHSLGRQLAPVVGGEAGAIMSCLLPRYLACVAANDPARVASLWPYLCGSEDYIPPSVPERAGGAVFAMEEFLRKVRVTMGWDGLSLTALNDERRETIVDAALREGYGVWDREMGLRILTDTAKEG